MDVAGKRVTVMGLGRFGGGLGVTRWLVSQGADVLVTDVEPAEKLGESISKLRDLVDAGSVELRLGEHNVSDFTTCDLVVANPAVPKPWENRFLRAAKAAGISITTEIELSVQGLPDRKRVIGVTGSAGKSTTASLIARILRECGQRVAFGGNIGGSLLEMDIKQRSPWVVLELSSFMLHWLEGWSPHVAVVTNITHNHLDWHGEFSHYERSKQQILSSQEPGDIAILADPSVAEWPIRAGVRRVVIEKGTRIGEMMLPGAHNQINAAGAIEAVISLGVPGIDRARAAAAAATYSGLPHRLQLVATKRMESGKPVRFYNDSKSTTPEATTIALQALGSEQSHGQPSDVHLIAGGYDKGSDLAAIARYADTLAGLYTIGATGDRIAELAPCANRVFRCGTVERALSEAVSHAGPGQAILLSPGCASWDQFSNYEERGDLFTRLAREAAGAFGTGDSPRA
jgi:UDP-N-acetylmuramoylalanine--D-glutamate ligase